MNWDTEIYTVLSSLLVKKNSIQARASFRNWILIGSIRKLLNGGEKKWQLLQKACDPVKSFLYRTLKSTWSLKCDIRVDRIENIKKTQKECENIFDKTSI